MPAKRRRSTNIQEREHAQPRAKRIKFTLDSVPLPSITKQGIVFVTGNGDVGQLGLGPDVMEKTRPAALDIKQEVVDVCAGGMHSVCLTKDGKVLTFGCNDEGALGRVCKDDDEFDPGFVDLPGKVIQVSAGDSHTCALMDDGRVYAWGTFRDSHGNMGLTINGNEKAPVQLMTDQYVMKIASGADHIVFLTRFGEVFTCGCAEQGQLGRMTGRGSGRNVRHGFGQLQVAKLLTPAPIIFKASLRLHFDNIWAGMYTTYMKVANKNEMYVCGLNNYNQIGIKGTAPQYVPVKSTEFSKHTWQSITCAQHHAVAVTDEGKVYVIGRREYGRLGLGEVEEDAQVLMEVPSLNEKKVVGVSCSCSQSFAVTDDGELYAWGMGNGGQLGTGSEDDCLLPTLVKGKQIVDKIIIKVASGGQHTVMLGGTKEDFEMKETKVEEVTEKPVEENQEPVASEVEAAEKTKKTTAAEEKKKKKTTAPKKTTAAEEKKKKKTTAPKKPTEEANGKSD